MVSYERKMDCKKRTELTAEQANDLADTKNLAYERQSIQKMDITKESLCKRQRTQKRIITKDSRHKRGHLQKTEHAKDGIYKRHLRV
ncbi:hypothetical protein [[Clostridium] polysaccharolyticum]|uniref:Uncharacterized protein n=1 Tax=[Clostridium] polysaccharolyticum TaxID=29364 RepID=A0A1I0FYX6_9FIRM|nr:hypothetical protein [[Clostridium] polysaccharolyticum]SET63743.1 hypothetical protein SAMN04487772_1427 [[Clostridium] polysaccharolyticum]